MESKRIQSTQLSRHLRHSCSRRSFPTLTARPMKTSSPWATWVRWQGQWRSLSFPARRRRNEPYILTRNKNSKFNKNRFLFFIAKISGFHSESEFATHIDSQQFTLRDFHFSWRNILIMKWELEARWWRRRKENFYSFMKCDFV